MKRWHLTEQPFCDGLTQAVFEYLSAKGDRSTLTGYSAHPPSARADLAEALDDLAQAAGEAARELRGEGAQSDIAARIATIADEAFGPFPAQSVEESLTAIERGIFEARRENERLRAENERLKRALDQIANMYPMRGWNSADTAELMSNRVRKCNEVARKALE